MFQRLEVRVDSIGEDVVLTMGNVQWRMGFETALVLSAQLRRSAQQAKRFAGDLSRTYSLTGWLHDAERGINAGQPHNPLRVPDVAREMLKRERIAVGTQGGCVVAQLGATEAKLPYQAAFPIAQWLRLRAKESKLRAGDVTRHWSAIAP